MDLKEVLAILKEEVKHDKQSLHAFQKVIDEKEVAIALLESKFGKKADGIVSTSIKNVAIDAIFSESQDQKQTMTSLVSQVISEHLGGREFNSSQVIQLMHKLGHIPAIDRKIGKRMASILARMHEKGELDQPFKGKGFSPHRYKLKGNAQNKSGKGEAASARTLAASYN